MTAVLCPCCGQPMVAPYAPLDGLASAPLTRQHRSIVNALVQAYPQPVTTEDMLNAMYGDSGRRAYCVAGDVLKVQLAKLRRILPAYGWTIPVCNGGKGHYGRYKLEPLPAKGGHAANGFRLEPVRS